MRSYEVIWGHICSKTRVTCLKRKNNVHVTESVALHLTVLGVSPLTVQGLDQMSALDKGEQEVDSAKQLVPAVACL